MTALTQTDCPSLRLVARGKVRDIYEVPEQDDALLFVATDRVSAFDKIMLNGIPGKGKLLTQLSLFFFELLSSHPRTKHIPNHVITSEVAAMPQSVQKYKDQLEGRAILVRKATVLPIEAIVRGYITGSAWKEYKRTGTVHEIKLAENLQESQAFDGGAIFTPSTKAEQGDHDENIHPSKVAEILKDQQLADKMQDYALALYEVAAEHSRQHGLVLADTKFEFGQFPGGELALVDEALTPDSSRFWPLATYKAGEAQVGFDKQFVRQYLLERGLDKTPDGVELPEDIVQGTWRKYLEAFEMLTGRPFA